MTNTTILFVFLASTACLVFETRAAKQVQEKTLLRTRLLDPSGDDKKTKGPLDHILGAPKKILDAIDKAIPEPESTRESKDKDTKKDVEPTQKPQPRMDAITIMRGEMCLGRGNLIGHSSCMDWLVSECTTKSAGTGLCKRVRAHVKKECIAKNEKACDYAKVLGIDIPKEETTTAAPVTTPAPVQEKAPEKDAKKAPEKEAKAPASAAKKEEGTPAPKQEAPAPKAKKDKAEPKKEEAKPASKGEPAKYEDPVAKDGLQSQGFSGKMVEHSDGKTVTRDWGKEYGNGEATEPKSGARSWNMRAFLCLAAAALACVSA